MVYSRKICYNFIRIFSIGDYTMNVKKLDRERLIYCRKKLGITKQEAAKRMQMSQPAYLRYESGERTPSIHVVQVMADVLGTSVAYLTGESDNPKPDSYIIKSNSEPKLFELIEAYRNVDTETQKRLMTYLLQFIKEK